MIGRVVEERRGEHVRGNESRVAKRTELTMILALKFVFIYLFLPKQTK